MKKYFLILTAIFCLSLPLFFYGCGSECAGGTDTGNPSCETDNEGSTGDGDDTGDDGDTTGADEADEQAACEDAGKEWIEFTSSCADLCISQREDDEIDVECSEESVFGCECGEERCWNDETLECEDL
ncbi:MAG: hypothetical protein HYU99_00490 [Deltaproteobacteria bacterium]|nr:hypothetical protein [Deltaproteobacteria bacterium]